MNTSYNGKYHQQLTEAVTASCKELGLQVTEEEFSTLLDVEILFGISGFYNNKTFVDTGKYSKDPTNPSFVRNVIETLHMPNGEDVTYYFVDDFINSVFDERYQDFETLRDMAKYIVFHTKDAKHFSKDFKHTEFMKRAKERKIGSPIVIEKILNKLREEFEFYEPPLEVMTMTKDYVVRRIKEIALSRR